MTPTRQDTTQQDNPAITTLALLGVGAFVTWSGYRWLTRTTIIDLPLLLAVGGSGLVTVLAAAHLWKGTHPAPATDSHPERWRLAFAITSATIATAGAVFTATLAAIALLCHAPLIAAAGLALAAATAASGFTLDRYRLASRRAVLRSTLIQALYGPLGHRSPAPAVIPTLKWEPKTTVPTVITVCAQRPGTHYHTPDNEPPHLDDTTTPLARGDAAGAIRRALRSHCNAHYRVTADPSGVRYTATRYVPDPVDERLAELTRKVRDVFGSSASVPTEHITKNGDTITGFTVKHDIGHKLTGEFRKRLAEQNLTELIGGAWRTSWDMTAATVTFTTKPTLPKIVYPTAVPEVRSISEAVDQYRQTRLTFGVDLDMGLQEWDPLDSPHTLVSGKTNAGKTVFLRTLIMQAARRGWANVLVDFKGGSFADLVDWPQVHIISNDPYESIATIHRMYKLMNERNARGRWDQRVWDNNLPYLIIVDEFTQLSVVLKRIWASLKPQRGAPKDPPALTELGELARLCRTARMHLVVGMQRPDADFLDTENRDNFGNKVSVGPISRIAADMLFENAYTGRYVPRIKGRGMATGLHEEPRETQFFYTPAANTTDAEEARIIAALRPSATLIPRYVPELPTNPAAATWAEIADAPWYPLSERPDLDPVKISRQLTHWVGDSRLGFGNPSDDADPARSESTIELTVPASELAEGDVLTLDGRTAYVDGIEIDDNGAMTVMWSDDDGRLCVSSLDPDEPHTVMRGTT
ncbi:FtsK/SpoIIIE domain-containing protein [Mycobacterium avium]|uniref:FtsK/SpoIIIE domain-containing protein n=1 Tax=Mycobacterium avium TaxID=1764 RepID=UPI0009FD0126|nr:FtsK/SpoIIIE domain-containing protein [Mycobacterium avium]